MNSRDKIGTSGTSYPANTSSKDITTSSVRRQVNAGILRDERKMVENNGRDESDSEFEIVNEVKLKSSDDFKQNSPVHSSFHHGFHEGKNLVNDEYRTHHSEREHCNNNILTKDSRESRMFNYDDSELPMSNLTRNSNQNMGYHRASSTSADKSAGTNTRTSMKSDEENYRYYKPDLHKRVTYEANNGKNMKKQQTDFVYECPVCQISFTDASKFSEHMKAHKLYKKKNDIQMIDISHGEPISMVKKFECFVCARVFLYETNLTKHMNMHKSLFISSVFGNTSARPALLGFDYQDPPFMCISDYNSSEDQYASSAHLARKNNCPRVRFPRNVEGFSNQTYVSEFETGEITPSSQQANITKQNNGNKIYRYNDVGAESNNVTAEKTCNYARTSQHKSVDVGITDKNPSNLLHHGEEKSIPSSDNSQHVTSQLDQDNTAGISVPIKGKENFKCNISSEVFDDDDDNDSTLMPDHTAKKSCDCACTSPKHKAVHADKNPSSSGHHQEERSNSSNSQHVTTQLNKGNISGVSVRNKRYKSYKCNICSEDFHLQKLLRDHKKAGMHKQKGAGKTSVESVGKPGISIFSCNLCPCVFSTKKGLIAHKHDHNLKLQQSKTQRNKSYTCNICLEDFRFEKLLWAHMKVCSLKQIGMLNAAKNTVASVDKSSISPFSCIQCQRVFPTIRGLITHMRFTSFHKLKMQSKSPENRKNKSNGKPEKAESKPGPSANVTIYKCIFCSREFDLVRNFAKHIIAIHKIRREDVKQIIRQ